MSELTLDRIDRELQRLPSPPKIVMELLQSMNNEDFDLSDIAQKIAHDQALAAKVLRLANSPFYGLTGRVASIREATILLGVHAIRTLVSAAAMTGCFPGKGSEWFNHQAFWRHAVGTGLCARALSRRVGIDENSAFTAGLLHDIGRLVLVTCFPSQYQAVVSRRQQSDSHLLDAEREVLGLDHTDVGKLLAERWRFAPLLSEAIVDHHRVENHAASPVAMLVHLADAMAHALDFGREDNDDLVPALNQAAWKQLNISWEQFRQAMAEADAVFEHASLALAA